MLVVSTIRVLLLNCNKSNLVLVLWLKIFFQIYEIIFTFAYWLYILLFSAMTCGLLLFLCPRDRRSGGILFLSCLSFCLPLWNLNLANNFWKVSARALIFHMSIPRDKTFQWVPLFFTLWPWPWSLTYFFKTLTVLITFELWVLELWYFTWVFLVIRPIRWYHNFWPCDLDLRVWPIF